MNTGGQKWNVSTCQGLHQGSQRRKCVVESMPVEAIFQRRQRLLVRAHNRPQLFHVRCCRFDAQSRR